ncbi:MAG: cysteine peptidase family C39 domain-containing protein [Planctomycetota bacterium]
MGGTASVYWFIGLAIFAALSWGVGFRLGSGPVWRTWATLGIGIALILGWAWLVRRPSVAVHVIPVRVLSRIEGVGGVPIFMLILGVAWARCRVPRQRHVVAWGMMLGAIYFVNGGMWLLQETPSAVMGQSVAGTNFRQTQDYTCVPAACATALNMMEIPSTEAQMAELTQTRPGTGATIIRALDGLGQRLRNTGIKPVLFEPDWDALQGMPPPLLTPLQFEATRRHMVVISRIDRGGVWVMDPVEGFIHFSKPAFLDVYRRQVIAFDRP